DTLDKLLPVEKDMQESYMKYIRKMPSTMINKLYAKIFAGGFQHNHDMVVPVYSQLAKHFKCKHIERRLVERAIHDQLPGLIVPTNQIIYNHPEAHRLIVKFAQEKFTS